MLPSYGILVLKKYVTKYVPYNEQGEFCDELKILIGSVEITAYVPTYINVEEGDYLTADIRLTNCWADFSTVALTLSNVKKVSKGDIKSEKYVRLKVTGALVKQANRTVKQVGKNKKPFYSCALRFDNGRGKYCSVLLVGFNKIAEDLYSAPVDKEVCIDGQLFESLSTGGYEIRVRAVNKKIIRKELKVCLKS